MLGKTFLLGALAALVSIAVTVAADNVLALTPDDFDKACPPFVLLLVSFPSTHGTHFFF